MLDVDVFISMHGADMINGLALHSGGSVVEVNHTCHHNGVKADSLCNFIG